MYGSDYPYQPTQVLVAGKRRLEEAIAESQRLSQYKEMFFAGNASKALQSAISANLVKAVENIDSMLVRISEIDVFPEYLDEYMKAALTVGA